MVFTYVISINLVDTDFTFPGILIWGVDNNFSVKDAFQWYTLCHNKAVV